MSKTALVPGGAGFVGSNLCEFLLEKGYRVYAVDNLVTGRRENINHLLDHPRFNWIEHDITVPFFMNEPCDEIYNLASPASPIDFEQIPEFILQTGSIGHLNMLKWAKQHEAKILLASTSEVYGNPLEHPQKETYFGNVNTIGPRGCYDEAKRFAEAMTVAYQKQHGLDTRIVRIFNTYGPRMRPQDGRVIPNFFKQALTNQPFTIYGDGTQTRSLCFVTDLVEGIYALMQSNVTEPVNIGNQNECTITDIAKHVALCCNVEYQCINKPLPQNDPLRRRPDTSRAKSHLGWEPKVDLKEGLQQTKDYFEKEKQEGRL